MAAALEDTSWVHYLPIATTLVALPFVVALVRRHRERGAAHLLWWAAGVSCYGLGTALESTITLAGNTPALNKAWYVAGAVLGAYPLAQGTVYLLLTPRKARILTWVSLPLVALVALLVLLSPVRIEALELHRPSGAILAWSWVRLMTPLINVYAVLFLVGGAALSTWRFSRTREGSARALGNALIALGALLPAIGGSLAKTGRVEALYVAELVGLLLIWAGYAACTRSPASPPAHSRLDPKETRMQDSLLLALVAPWLCLLVSSYAALSQDRLVIAHRGASGYLPEHTLAAKALAHGMHPDFIEQDVVLTRDDQPIVLHDIHLDAVTDVATVFPDRAREDGRYYALDFTLQEVRSLAAHERRDLETGAAVYPGRFPLGKSRFCVPTLAEEIELIQGLNHSTGRQVGIYVEIKSPSWHREQGHDITPIVLETLGHYGYRERDNPAWVQCFDPQELERLRKELDCQLKLVLLIGMSARSDTLVSSQGLTEIATFADGIGPSLGRLVEPRPAGWVSTGLVEDAHERGLVVHPYTLRSDSLPEGFSDLEQLLSLCFDELGVDGVFSDQPDRVLSFLGR